uniref:Uncharacterized protein n=1 Tax=Rhipicephalus microplus TaxID=6941 RepID=A0A6G5AJ54_RHIMP
MGELKSIQYLLEEEKLILETIEAFQKQINKLKVEEMSILSALRDQENKRSDGPKEENPGTYAGVSKNEELTNAEVIDLRVDDILCPAMGFSSRQQNNSEEEEENEPES